MPCLLLTADLMTASKATAAATRQGVELHVALSVEALLAKTALAPADLVILDLTTPSLNTEDVLSRLRASAHSPRRVLAFGPHVHEALLKSAEEAGCDEVLSRGQFTAQLDAILASVRDL